MKNERIKLLLDTDIGTDIDDAVALSYLLREERCELLGITTATTDPIQRAKLASALCIAAERPDIPIIPGAGDPLFGDSFCGLSSQQKAIERLPHSNQFPDITAVEFMRRIIRDNPGEVTLLAIGPLTNVALLFALDREIPSLLNELVLMCGDFKSNSPEWNAKLDAFATAIVYSAEGLKKTVSYGFDVTSTFCLDREQALARFNGGIADTVREFVDDYLKKPTRRVFFHDPLAAVGIFHPEVCTYRRGDISVRASTEGESGYTDFTENKNGIHLVADTVDTEKFYDIYFSTVTR